MVRKKRQLNKDLPPWPVNWFKGAMGFLSPTFSLLMLPVQIGWWMFAASIWFMKLLPWVVGIGLIVIAIKVFR